ncbi:hypothetical protein AB0G53_21200 [Streptomyces sp. NPDC021722]|uniref:hypothetical protein n=1 Tax=Streptomyces sp. NPDC021722 TaxID=3154904 RepID=UPI0033CC0D69
MDVLGTPCADDTTGPRTAVATTARQLLVKPGAIAVAAEGIGPMHPLGDTTDRNRPPRARHLWGKGREHH